MPQNKRQDTLVSKQRWLDLNIVERRRLAVNGRGSLFDCRERTIFSMSGIFMPNPLNGQTLSNLDMTGFRILRPMLPTEFMLYGHRVAIRTIR